MAFDLPLEADKVDDSIFVSLLKGTLMWIIGDDEDDKKRREEDLRRGLQDMMMDDSSSSSQNEGFYESREEPTTSLPHLVRSEVSVGGEQYQPNLTSSIGSIFSSNFDTNNDNPKFHYRTEKKKMSWSENLVEYMDNEVRSHCSVIVMIYSLACWDFRASASTIIRIRLFYVGFFKVVQRLYCMD